MSLESKFRTEGSLHGFGTGNKPDSALRAAGVIPINNSFDAGTYSNANLSTKEGVRTDETGN